MRLLFLVCALVCSIQGQAKELAPDWALIESRLQRNGFERGFIQALKKSYEAQEFQNVVELNVLLFMKKSDYHGTQVTDEAAERVRAFLSENRATLLDATREHGVPGPVIASLLWIESRYGQNLGTFHAASVFLHLIQADRPDVIQHLRTQGPYRFTDAPLKKDLAKVRSRAKAKAIWALGELKALQKIFRQRGQFALAIRGSFSGAFGMSQFLPSSYSRWARPAKPGTTPDLNTPGDAIQSVANYLRQNGWRQKRPRTHLKALLNYNNSRDYANAILELARQTEGGPALASTTSTGADAASSLGPNHREPNKTK
ncbi:MAG: lytic murein transglycosylase [Bdellovibrionaceae bacterium]|nr:lytic murein transglycosylase [Pseudobdellovibrionaceae bacterium]